MGRRYSRITQSARYTQALNRYVQYLQGTLTRTSRVGTQGARGNTKTVYVVPFGFDLPTSTYVKSTVKPDDYTFLAPRINTSGTGGEVLENTVGDIEQRTGFSAARVVSFINSTRVVSVVPSDITGLQYLKYNGDRRSCPFGRKTATDDLFDSFDAIKAALRTANASAAVCRISLQKERYNY